MGIVDTGKILNRTQTHDHSCGIYMYGHLYVVGPAFYHPFCDSAVIDGKVIRSSSRHRDPKYSHTLVVKVEAVYYDEIEHIQPGDVVEIKICSLPDRVKRNSVYRLSGTRECGSNELEIGEYGIFAEKPSPESPCASFILDGGCDDLRP